MNTTTLRRYQSQFRFGLVLVGALLTIALTACTESTPTEIANDSNSSPETSGSETGEFLELTNIGTSSSLNIEAFKQINPEPDIRSFDYPDSERDSLPRDAIRPVYSPAFKTVAETNLLPEELVMGVEINGDARAYPVGMLRIREMVNDEVGGTPILVTW